MAMTTENDRQEETAREIICRLLAACYYELGPEFAEERVFEVLADAASRIDAGLAAHARRLGEAFADEALENLHVDYARLFLGPPHAVARPYGSVWLSDEGTLMQDSTMAVLELYRQGGFEIDEDFRELPDHVAAELEFLYLLIFRENQARRTGRRDDWTVTAALRRRFLDEHLGAWIGPFAAAIDSAATTGFYRELARLTDRFVRMEAGRDSPWCETNS
jgi:putative dimethyl sulfoxide reductase chaperone